MGRSARRSARRAAVAAWIGIAALASAASGQAAGFDHGKHVSDVWLTSAEVARDCQGCHDYAQEDPAARRPPETVCASCHVFGAMEFPQGSYLDLDAEAGRAFDHGKHVQRRDGSRIDCITCHRPDGTGVPAVMPVPRGANVAMCAECHSTDAASRESFDSVIRGLLAERGATERRFRHDVHVPPERRDDPAECRRCHGEVYTADADNLGERQFSLERCSDCHGAEIAAQDVERPSRTAAGFLHYYHLDDPGAQDHPELAGQNCSACHAWNAQRGTYDLGPRFANGVYQGCLTCHAERDVAKLGGEHGADADCLKCHQVERGSLDAARAGRPDNRPRELLPRPRPTSFRLSAHAHPFVTTEDGPVDEDCAACHRAQVPAIPSNVDGRPFDHGTHLPARFEDLSADDCLDCHRNLRGESFSDLLGLRKKAAAWAEAGAEAAATPAEVAELQGRFGIFERASCERCHSDAIEPVFPESPLREVLWFSHEDHLNKFHPVHRRAFTCTDCHVVKSGDAGFDVRVGPSYRDCTECHGHADHPETTKGYGLELVQGCYFCHRVGVPAAGRPIPVARRTAGYAAGAIETHDRGGECASCHLAATSDSAWREPAERALLARKIDTPHALDSEYRRAGYRFFNQRVGDDLGRVYCIDCHWEWDALEFGPQTLGVYRNEPYARDDGGLLRTLIELRAEFGSDLASFPGFEGEFRE